MNPSKETSGSIPYRTDQQDQHDFDRLLEIEEMVKEISCQHDPQEMILIFRKYTANFFGGDGSISLSRRNLETPQFRITRHYKWKENINPWLEKDRLPLLKGGLMAELLYGNQPKILRDIRITPSDPAYEFMKDARSIIALPLYEDGNALNMVVRLSSDPSGFDQLNLSDALLIANLFGRATGNLLMARKLKDANARLDYEMQRVAEIQRSLLPATLPDIPGLDISVLYKTAAHAGGDYYDFFDLGDGRWGVLIADVSGHGTPAAVVMAMLQTMLHAQCVECSTASEVLQLANRQLLELTERYDEAFVTAFYGVYHSNTRTFTYSSAGHNPPLLVNKNIKVHELDQAQTHPLAVQPVDKFSEATVKLQPGDTMILYTDGIIEAINNQGEMYGKERLLNCICEQVHDAQYFIDCVEKKLTAFTGDGPQVDDQTLLVLRVK